MPASGSAACRHFRTEPGLMGLAGSSAGKSQVAGRYFDQYWRSRSRVRVGRGIFRSRVPLPARTQTTIRRLSMSAARSRVASDTRRPHEYIIIRLIRAAGRRTRSSSRQTSDWLRTVGNFLGCLTRSRFSTGHWRRRVRW